MATTADVASEFAALNKLYSSGDPVERNPFPMYRELRDKRPIMDGDILARYGVPSQADYILSGRQIYSLFRYEDVARALQDDETFSAGLQAIGLGDFLGDGILTAYSGTEHRKLRGAMAKALTPTTLRDWRSQLIEPQIRNHLEALKPRGKCDLVSEFTLRFPIDVVYRILGYPDDSEFAAQFAGWALRILSGTPTDPEAVTQAHAAALEASRNIYDATLEVVKARRKAGADGTDMMSRMISAEYEGETLDDHIITSLIRGLLPAAAETTTRTLGNMLVLLMDRPEMLSRLRDDRSLMTKAITETMRMEPTAAYLARETRVDTEFHGVKVPAGTALSLCIGSANRDERVFENPDELDFDRKLTPTMLGFGAGAHICLGMPLARLEVEVAMNAILDILPAIRRDSDAPRSEIVGLNLRGPDDLNVCWY
ncbi:cytochrome P450 [Novosphingobium sp. CECT 9465]|uniref:cytochrome P450 n=1 Tax=Novosphingobium sp. CECT 9465 TaxID=2829794 RepID=UPI001E564B27|nr:cytochrome P450 [Novosphingobium sp. CECT 9465]CAH0498218.1 Pulcherriminic acid synthase [Novosphingobium sp. CECT 9465]